MEVFLIHFPCALLRLSAIRNNGGLQQWSNFVETLCGNRRFFMSCLFTNLSDLSFPSPILRLVSFVSEQHINHLTTIPEELNLRSRHLEVVGTRKNGCARRRHPSCVSLARARSLFRPLLPSACYAGQEELEISALKPFYDGCARRQLVAQYHNNGPGRHKSFTPIEHCTEAVSREGLVHQSSLLKLLNIYLLPFQWVPVLALIIYSNSVHTVPKYGTKPIRYATLYLRNQRGAWKKWVQAGSWCKKERDGDTRRTPLFLPHVTSKRLLPRLTRRSLTPSQKSRRHNRSCV